MEKMQQLLPGQLLTKSPCYAAFYNSWQSLSRKTSWMMSAWVTWRARGAVTVMKTCSCHGVTMWQL